MSTSGIIGEEIDKHAALASAALRNISAVGAGPSAKQLLPRAVFDMLGPYSAALFFAERVVQSDQFNAELVRLSTQNCFRLSAWLTICLLPPGNGVTSTIQI
ncbi:MAG TPA: hypothetical protein VNY05_28865 [Candidatus Acidoferrales bacterium]|nr:hypothetical protein [Candidatus Acidoferrales bacterium]